MSVFTKPSDIAPPPKRDAGGDNTVPRDSRGRPLIIVPCWLCDGTGKVPSKKVEGRLNKCQGCKSEGKRTKAYTRTTTYIDCIEDKSNLETWQMRMVLVGVDRDRSLLDGASDLQHEYVAAELAGDEARQKEIKDDLNRKALIAKEKAGAEDKADKGTHLHALSELVDEGKHLPPEISFADVVDMDAYKRATTPFFDIVHMEKLVVHDEYKIAGTPDRVSRWKGDYELVAPDGTIISPDELLITDLKTGTVQYGALKMAMQLSIYSRSHLYDHETGDREPLGNINQKWGIIMNLPAGSGECTLYWADLTLGWRAVEVAKDVRALRSESRKALSVITHAKSSFDDRGV